jgi:NADH-quinone oxidoreductase subunit C
MDKNELIEKVSSVFGAAILKTDETSDILTLTVDSDSIIPVMKFLKEKLAFNFLTDLCGIHYPNQELPLGVVYHMHNFVENTRIRLKTFVSGTHPNVATATNLFPAANWMERETFDFYGILFDGHPNLKRILNVDYLDYFPMRKEYPLEDPTRHDKDDRFFGR